MVLLFIVLIMIIILLGYSLRSQEYNRYRTLTYQCLSGLLDSDDIKRPEHDHLKNIFSRLQIIIDAKLLLTAEEDILKDQMVHKMYLDNEKIESKADEIKKEREVGETKFDNLLQTKLEVIDKHRRFINESNETVRSQLNAEM